MNLQPLGDRLIVSVLEEEETTASGISPSRTPAEVATPFPPRKRSQTGKVWPRMQASPPAIPTSSWYGPPGLIAAAKAKAIRTAANPFKASRAKTRYPHRLPRTRSTLVAPIFPLPCFRMSIPRVRLMSNPFGQDPSRYPIAATQR